MSSFTNAPRSNKIWIIGSAKINNPMADGKEINKENSRDLFWMLFTDIESDCFIVFDRLGKKWNCPHGSTIEGAMEKWITPYALPGT